MRIPQTSWTDYIDRLSRINQKAGELMRKYIEQHGTGDADALIRYAHALVTKYGEGSAELACQMYDAAAEASGVALPPAEPAETASREEVARMVNGNRNSPPNLQSGVSRFVKQAAADTTLKNAARDGAEWAWVPHGDTCPFCIMLASNGWQKAGKKTLEGGHAKHIHANCNCEYAVRFDSRTTVAGYDPEKYSRQYEDADGDINLMRRIQYARNRVKINEQKRAAYALRQKNRGKKVFITDMAVHKVPLVSPNGADDVTSIFIQDTHRKLLEFSKDQNNSNEVACLIDLKTRERLWFVKGDEISVDVEKDADSYHWLRTKETGSIMLCHNHPGQSYFSANDVKFFIENDSVGSMSIVTNQGKVWTISKTERFDFNEAFADIKKRISECNGNYDKAIDGFLKNGYNFGIERS